MVRNSTDLKDIGEEARDFRSGIDRVKREDLVTTFAKQFLTRYNFCDILKGTILIREFQSFSLLVTSVVAIVFTTE